MDEFKKTLSLSSKMGENAIKQIGLNLDDLPDDIAEVLRPLDLNGDKFIAQDEIVVAAKALQRTQKRNSQLKRAIFVMIFGYFLFVSTIIGLVYWVVKLNKDTVVLPGSSALMTSVGNGEQPQPVSVSSNEVAVSLGMLVFLPEDIVSKVTSFVLYDEDSDTKLFRNIASIDIRPKESFSVTTTVGDTLTWDSNDMTDRMMLVTLADGTFFTKSVLCDECSALNVVSTDERVPAAIDSLYEAFAVEDDSIEDDNNNNTPSATPSVRQLEVPSVRQLQRAFFGDCVGSARHPSSNSSGRR